MPLKRVDINHPVMRETLNFIRTKEIPRHWCREGEVYGFEDEEQKLFLIFYCTRAVLAKYRVYRVKLIKKYAAENRNEDVESLLNEVMLNSLEKGQIKT